MIIYPAIDIRKGRCVRLIQGDFSKVTTYSDNPVDVAKKWEKLGAQYLHVVDLDGARTGKCENINTIKEIINAVNIPVQIGGGIRDEDAIKDMLHIKASRVILGTSAVNDSEFVKHCVNKYKNQIAVGIDAKDGKVAVEGWEKVSEISACEFALHMQNIGVKTIIYTDISRDGMLKGPNFLAVKQMVRKLNIDVIASGGVSSMDDLTNLKLTGASGAIVGKALYTGNVDLKDAIMVVNKC